MGIFLDGAIYDFLNGAIVAKVNDLHAGGLKDPAHDVDGYIMSVEQ
jgi:hypothetical protein